MKNDLEKNRCKNLNLEVSIYGRKINNFFDFQKKFYPFNYDANYKGRGSAITTNWFFFANL